MNNFAQAVTDVSLSTNKEGQVAGAAKAAVEQVLNAVGLPERIGQVRELTICMELDRESGTRMMIVVHD